MSVKLSIIFLLCVVSVKTANILGVFPTPSISHQFVFRKLTHELAKRGHNVTVITTDPNGENIENLREIDVKTESYKYWVKKKPIPQGKTEEVTIEDIINGYTRLITDVFIDDLNNYEVKQLINSNVTFDLLITEAWVRPTLAFSHKFNALNIRFSSFCSVFHELDILGSLGHPLIYPSVLFSKGNFNFWDKITEVYTRLSAVRTYDKLEEEEYAKLKMYFGSEMPPLSELNNNVDLLFMNSNNFWQRNRPTLPSIALVGGIHLNAPKELPKDLKQYLDESNRGVVYVSFGTNAILPRLPPHQIRKMFNVFSQLPYDVLLKWDYELPDAAHNIRTAKWFPQGDVLRHPKIKAFITQGGMQSSDEAIDAAVPLIGIPLASDQFYNVAMYVQLKIGQMIDIQTFTEELLNETIHKVINDDSYRRNIHRLKSIMHDTPYKPLDLGVWWTEHILKHGAQHLRSPAHNMPWIEYLELELVVSFIVMVLCVLFIVSIIIYYFVKFIKHRYYNVPNAV